MARYARGHKAWGICERCSERRPLNDLIYDGQFPDLKVCPDCWDPKHPQEYLPSVTDPSVLYDPTGDPGRAQASQLVISFPRWMWTSTIYPMQIGLIIGSVATTVSENSGSFSSTSFDTTSFSTTSFHYSG